MQERGLPLPVERVQALQRGATQFRFPVKPQWLPGAPKSFPAYELDDGQFGFANEEDVWISPYGKPGDHLWVRETFATWPSMDHVKPSKLYSQLIHYRATYDEKEITHEPSIPAKWRPSIHIPRWASRYLLEVVSVRLERVQEIGASDCMSEGILLIERDEYDYDPDGAPNNKYQVVDEAAMVEDFGAFWDSMFAKNGFAFDSNPWVWVVEHRRVEA